MANYFNKEEKPKNEKEFLIWFSELYNFKQKDYSNYYNQVTNNLRENFCNTPYWNEVKKQYKDWDNQYYSDYNVNLFTSDEAPKVVIKSLDSLLNKAYRKNVLRNNNFPNEPEGGWITPDNWFDNIHDIIRTSFVVKYLDGVKFVESKLKELAKNIGMDDSFLCEYEARDDGYYAAHAGIRLSIDLLTKSWTMEKHIISVEMQITTELQEMIKALLHKYYEKNRTTIIPEDYKWQWDYRNEQFVPNYMGHIAHYIEGMIVEIRDKQNKIQ